MPGKNPATERLIWVMNKFQLSTRDVSVSYPKDIKGLTRGTHREAMYVAKDRLSPALYFYKILTNRPRNLTTFIYFLIYNTYKWN